MKHLALGLNPVPEVRSTTYVLPLYHIALQVRLSEELLELAVFSPT